MTAPETLVDLLQEACAESENRLALVGVDGSSMTYAELLRMIGALGLELRGRGIARNDRVAMVMPDGVQAAVAFVGLSSFCACAPFNPGYTAPEFEAFFRDCRPKAVVLAAGGSSAARLVAEKVGVPVWELAEYRLSGPGPWSSSSDGPARPSDVALTLYTSGTTSRPKLVPLTQANLCASAYNIARTLHLSPADRCLNVMPLFHVHGLVAGLLSPLAAGGGVVCASGFSAGDFSRWLDDLAPTWYTAVPTMHQAILARLGQGRAGGVGARLRFIRSSSSPLPPALMAALESAFDAPVIEAYGMTEATHQIASNPLPPAPRKPGSVGLPAGAEIVILGEGGDSHPLRQGAVGEVAVRGPGVTAGYAGNPEATADASIDEWFRTGDQGYLDADGYLTLTGRLKELINRGGEKIAPREVEEALLGHPAVSQAVAFAAPDASYGEQVAAAVVLVGDTSVTVEDLQRHVADRLAYFKVPRRVVIVDDLPKGPTGKLQRRTLAATLGMTGEETDSGETPRADPALEREIASVWCQVLECGSVPVDAAFIALGGDSLAAVRVVNRLRAKLGLELTVSDFFRAPTVREQAQIAERALRHVQDVGRGVRGVDEPGRQGQKRALGALARAKPHGHHLKLL